MGQCNAQTNACPSGVVPRRVDQSTAQEPITTKKEPLLQPATRGLELISSCAKFYANGVVVAKPAIQLSPVAALNQPAMRQMCPSKVSKPSISTVAVYAHSSWFYLSWRLQRLCGGALQAELPEDRKWSPTMRALS